jgi:hypothetical protein
MYNSACTQIFRDKGSDGRPVKTVELMADSRSDRDKWITALEAIRTCLIKPETEQVGTWIGGWIDCCMLVSAHSSVSVRMLIRLHACRTR